MLQRPTVFVIGAGAGDGLNMPLGDRLSEIIANDVDFNFHESGNLHKGNSRIYGALRRIKKMGVWDGSGPDFVAAGRMISGGVRYTKSIDNYIHAHMETKQSPGSGGPPEVYATAVNRPAPDLPILRGRISAMLSGRGNIVLLLGTCKDLFRDYGTTLSS
jgi:hypothetical protein